MKRKFLKNTITGFMILSIVLGQISAVAPAFARGRYASDKEIIFDKNDSGNVITSVNGPRTKSAAKNAKKADLSDAEKKISTDLLKLVNDDFLAEGESRTDVVHDMKGLDQYVDKTDAARTKLKKQTTDRDNLVYAYVETKEGVSTDAINANVWEVTGRDEQHHLAAAYVEINKLEELAALPGIDSIKTVTPPRVRKGTVTSQGDLVHKTAEVRSAYTQQGTGVKVGLISDGMASSDAAKATGDISDGLTRLSNYQSGDEGTAMAEILYDMAPGILLYFHQGGNNMMDFNAAVDELVANGCKIIVDDMGWDEEAFFENGVIGDHIASVMASKDVVFIAAAGNEADVHYQGTYYNDHNYPGYQDFSHGTSNSPSIYVTLPAGEELDVILQWNDRFGAAGNDFDLEIYDTDTEELLEESADTQDGNDNPTEAIYYTNNSGKTRNIKVDVYNYDGSSSSILELYLWPSDGTVSSKNIVAADSVWGHPVVKGVMTVGAIGANDSGYDTIESYSSRGPSTIIGESPRAKPDIIALDNVSVSGAGGFDSTFSGTSASAPAVGAIVAQLWGAFPALKGTQIRDAILNSAVDLGPSGFDYTYGYGRVDALRAYQSLSPTVTKSSDKAITSFTLSEQAGAINESNHSVTINLPAGTAVTSLSPPTIAVSAKATISPASGAPKNFTSPVIYTVTAEDGSTQAYVVTAASVASNDTDTTAPTITLKGSSSIELILGNAYNEQGANASDNVDGTVNVIISGAVNTSTTGVYVVKYTATDSAGNVAIVNRTVRVVSAASTASKSEITSLTVAIPAGIVDGDIIQCKTSANPNAVYIVKIVGNKAFIRHIVSLQIFNYYKHLKWENLRQVGSLDAFSLSGWVRVNTGVNETPRAEDKVWEVNGDQTRHWINMTAQQFLAHGGSDEAIYTINQGELNLYAIGPDVMSL